MPISPKTDGRGDRSFLSYLGEPHRYRSRSDQLLKQMDDNRCGCAATCPFHRIPGQQWDLTREKAPWDPQEP